MDKVDIHKAGGVLIKDRKFLISRSKGKTFFIAPGGKLEAGETPEESLIRELHEELGIDVTTADLEKFETFFAQATGQDGKYLQMDVFFVNHWEGEIQPASEIEEVMWINSNVPEGIEIGSIFQHEVLPRLKEQDLID